MKPAKKVKTTVVTVGNETWSVPRGFGAAYRREAKRQLEEFRAKKPGKIIDIIQDILGLIGYTASRETIADWDLRKRVEAVVYAANVHARASDNPIQAHPKPKWLPEPWRGADDGIWGNRGTEILS